MRPDMKKVIVSRPRAGGGAKRKTSKRGGHEPMRPRLYDNKEQTDLLGPLRRFLKSHAGEQWDDVWSEICQHADYRSMMGSHLRRHVSELVQHPRLEDDGLLYDNHGLFDINSPYVWREFYVDPRNGKLCTTQGRRKWKPTPEPKKVFELDGMLYHQYDGLWYRVKMQEIKSKHIWYVSDEFITLKRHTNDAYGWLLKDSLKKAYGLSPNNLYWYCVWKQSANSKEIKKLKKE